MSLLDEQSLARTLDAINEIHFTGRHASAAQRAKVAAWIASRQGQPRCYCGLFAPTEADLAAPVKLFTGERVTSNAGRSHVMGQEAYRALLLLGAGGRVVSQALNGAEQGMMPRLEATSVRWGAGVGEYCCGTCSVSVWRAMAAGAYPQLDRDAWLAGGVRSLRACRTGVGQWRRYPQWYTLLALVELAEVPGAVEEMRYAAQRVEKALKRAFNEADACAARRGTLAQRVLALV